MKPRLFIGSSTEGLDFAYAMQLSLEQDAEITVWSQGIFEPTKYNLEALLSALDGFDFGTFVFTLDDLAVIRDSSQMIVRDNVILELGLFLGRLGRDRCFIVMPKSRGVWHLPTDLLGIYPLNFEPNRSDANLEAAMGPVCHKIRNMLRKLGSFKSASSSVLSPYTIGRSFDELPGNASIFQRAYRAFESTVKNMLNVDINENTAEVMQAARTDAENQTFQKDPLPEHVSLLKEEMDYRFNEMIKIVLQKPATPYTSDVIRVISIGRSNAFYKLDKALGLDDT
jgi:hypothetical protein